MNSLEASRRTRPTRPWSPGLWFLLPALLLALVVFWTPHAFDTAVSRLFFESGGWLGTNDWVEQILCKGLRALPAAVSLFVLALLVMNGLSIRSGRPAFGREAQRRFIYILAAMAISGALVWLLKGATHVACPWDTLPFGGTEPLVSPALWPLGWDRRGCWPAGHAATGFCLFALFFALRDCRPRAARTAFALALATGLLCGMVRVMQGAHFVSHVFAALLVDWLVCASLYVLFFEAFSLKKALAKLLSERPGATFCVSFSALWWAVALDAPFLGGLLGDPLAGSWKTVLFVLTSAAMLALLNAAVLFPASLLPRRLFIALLIVLHAAGAAAFTGTLIYGVVFTPDMVRNILATDTAEASGYASARTAGIFLLAFLPPALVTLRLRASRGERKTPDLFRLPPWLGRSLRGALCLLCAAALLAANFQAFAGAMRNDKSLRYRIAPVNILWSGAVTLLSDESPDSPRVRLVVDEAPEMTVRPEAPVLFVVVAGETARSASWGLSGYGRQTTPLLSMRRVISFDRVLACGTSTDQSLPCMFSRIGRSDYDRERILSEEALPDVLQRAGFDVEWIDNQSGCKGVCAGVPSRRPAFDPKHCTGEDACRDSVLLAEVERAIAALQPGRPRVLFLHMIGSHGPAYHERSFEDVKVYRPECRSADFSGCTEKSIHNAYDNSILETDRVLSGVIDRMAAVPELRGGLLYLSDHGESLGEKGLYLHGAPYLLAPSEQKEVPMVMWFTPSFEKDFRVNRKALESRTPFGGVTHEHFYSTVLGLLGVKSATRRDAFDLTAGDRKN